MRRHLRRQSSLAETFSSLGHDPNLQYSDYTGFWALQESLQVVEKLFEKPENWKHFHAAMTKLLKQFEKYPTSAEQREPWTPPEPAPQRQVCRARAFRVQMDDPQLRIQFLTQVLIAFQALEQDVSSRRDRPGGLISTQPDSIHAQLKEIRSCIEKVLTQTRASVGTMVTHVLARESHWVNWKGMGCREWEHDSLEMLTGKAQEIDVVGTTVSFPKYDKPKLDPTIRDLLKEVKDFTPPVIQPPRTDSEGNPEPCALELRRIGEQGLDRHEGDEDPANGIEEEYKAKYNKAFMWQSRRLFGRHHIRVYARKEVSGKTDFMDFVRSARNRNPPPPEPAKEPEVASATSASAAPAPAAVATAAATPAPAAAEAPAVADVLEAAVAAAEAVADTPPGGEPVSVATEARNSENSGPSFFVNSTWDHQRGGGVDRMRLCFFDAGAAWPLAIEVDPPAAAVPAEEAR
ncbi:THO1 [Symbiodinium natans]|uniref:THO1 protein n=1 Tax=Symbiodinium natans TaxID=878477 RepID=A0A812RWI7_9DINO|nr:THO1 [Symbiodinium natans]